MPFFGSMCLVAESILEEEGNWCEVLAAATEKEVA